jgi:hypothetical protein
MSVLVHTEKLSPEFEACRDIFLVICCVVVEKLWIENLIRPQGSISVAP